MTVRTVSALLLVPLLAITGAAPSALGMYEPLLSPPEDLWILNANVVDVVTGTILGGCDLMIRDEFIHDIRPHGDVSPAVGRESIDAAGGFLIPGLFDLYQHSAYIDLATAAGPYPDGTYNDARSLELLRLQLMHGVTTVRNVGSPRGVGVDLRDRQAAGSIVAPRIVTSDRILDQTATRELMFIRVTRPDEVRLAIGEQVAMGVDFIATYAGLSSELTGIAVEECRNLGVPLMANPQRTSWATAAELGVPQFYHGFDWSAASLPEERRAQYREIRRARGMKARLDWMEWLDLEGSVFQATIETILLNQVTITPTMMAYATKFTKPRYAAAPEVKNQPPFLQDSWSRLSFIADWDSEDFKRGEVAWDKALKYLRILFDSGVQLRLGSDFPNPYVLAGAGMHQEMVIFERAGIPTEVVLRLATLDAARTLDLDEQLGSIESGKIADLILLRSNPLERISGVREIVWVMQGGKLLRF